MDNKKIKGGKSIAIMQPYFFPYIGYFQLIAAADQFTFHDDVEFIERGWIHRNRLLIEGKAKYLTIPRRSGSKYEMINEVEHVMDTNQKLTRNYLANLVKAYYQKAPFFEKVFPIIKYVLMFESQKIADLAIESVKETCKYLGMEIPVVRTSETMDKQNLARMEKLIYICKSLEADTYINAPGGKKLYSKAEFQEHNIHLLFLDPGEITYPQFGEPFVPRLSIIDVMMFNPPGRINEMLKQYRLQ